MKIKIKEDGKTGDKFFWFFYKYNTYLILLFDYYFNYN